MKGEKVDKERQTILPLSLAAAFANGKPLKVLIETIKKKKKKNRNKKMKAYRASLLELVWFG